MKDRTLELTKTGPIRIWQPIKDLLQRESEKFGYVISDLTSAILFEALKDEHLVFYTLIDWFYMDPETAREEARKISSTIRILQAIEEEEAEEYGEDWEEEGA